MLLHSSACDSVHVPGSMYCHVNMKKAMSAQRSAHPKTSLTQLIFAVKVTLLSLIICGSILPTSAYEIWSIYFDDMRPSMSRDGRTRSQLFEVPFPQRRHMFELATYINVSNERRIRRMELSLCEEIAPANGRKLPNGSPVTNPENGATYACVQRIASQTAPVTLNSTIVRFPQDVGLPLDRNEPDLRALLLTIEYTQDHSLLQDNSGFDLYLSDEPLPIEAGVMAVGLMPDRRFFLPPNMEGWTTKGTCHSSCFDYKMEHNEFAVAAIVPSANHLSLNELTLEVTATDGTRRKIFAWGGESAVDMAQEALIGGNDKLDVRCRYRAANRTLMGGLGDGDENCLVWLHIYPRMDLDACLSSYSAGTIMSLLDTVQLNATTGETGLDVTVEGKQMIEFLEDKDRMNGWDRAKLLRSRYSLTHGIQVPQCGWKWHSIVPELRRR